MSKIQGAISCCLTKSTPHLFLLKGHSSLRELRTKIRFPDLGAEDKKVERINSSVTISTSDNESREDAGYSAYIPSPM